MGFELKTSEARVLGEVDYCSGRVIVGHGEPRWVRAWPKPFAADSWTARPVSGAKAQAAKAYTMAVSAWVQYRGVPVYQDWGEWLLSHTPPGKFDPWYDRGLSLRLAPLLAELAKEDLQEAPRSSPPDGGDGDHLWPLWGAGLAIDGALRADFADATGVGMGAQLRAESVFRQTKGPWPDHPLRGSQWDWAVKLGPTVSL